MRHKQVEARNHGKQLWFPKALCTSRYSWTVPMNHLFEGMVSTKNDKAKQEFYRYNNRPSF